MILFQCRDPKAACVTLESGAIRPKYLPCVRITKEPEVIAKYANTTGNVMRRTRKVSDDDMHAL